MTKTSLGQLLLDADILQRGAKLTGEFGELNGIILQIFQHHIEKVVVKFAPNRPHDWENHLAVLEVVYGAYILKIPVPELVKLNREIARKVRRTMQQREINLRFALRGIVFSATSSHQLENTTYPVYGGKHFELVRSTDGLVVATDEHYGALDRAMELFSAMNVMGNVGIYVNGAVHIAVLPQIQRSLKLKEGSPIRGLANHDWTAEIFGLLLKGLEVEVRAISGEERYELIEQWAVSEEDQWSQLLLRNAETAWASVAASEEDVFLAAVLSHQVEAPVVWSRTWGMDTVIAATVWVLFPPGPTDELRIVQQHYDRGVVVNKTVHRVAPESEDAARWLKFFANWLCQNPGQSVDFGYFVARLDSRATRFSNRTSGGGNYAYGIHLGEKTG